MLSAGHQARQRRSPKQRPRLDEEERKCDSLFARLRKGFRDGDVLGAFFLFGASSPWLVLRAGLSLASLEGGEELGKPGQQVLAELRFNRAVDG